MKNTILIVLCFAVSISMAIPQQINYQGKATDAAGVGLNGAYSITFKIFDVPSGGTELWSENHPSVDVHKGLFDVILGSVAAIDLSFDTQYYLEIQVEAETLTPRIPLSSVAYAYRAAIADSVVGGGSGSGISDINSQTGPSITITNGAGISVSSAANTITIANTVPDQTVSIGSGTGISVSGSYPNFTVTNTAPWTSSSNDYIQNQHAAQQSGAGFWTAGDGRIDGGNLLIDSPSFPGRDYEIVCAGRQDIYAANDLVEHASGNKCVITGVSGGANDQFQVAGVVEGTKIFVVDGNDQRVGIGTTSPDVILDVDQDGMGITKASEVAAAFTIDGSCFLNVLSTDDQTGILFGDAGDPDIGKLIYDNNDDAMKFTTNTSERMRITSTGNVGIGTTTPAAKLDVQLPSTAAAGMKAININVAGTATWPNQDYGIYSYVSQNNSQSAGVYGVTYSPSVGSGRNWGVKGYAYNGGTNIGVQGEINTTGSDNAAILGQVGDFDETTLNGDWAGYFYGDVNITGDLIGGPWTDAGNYLYPSGGISTNLQVADIQSHTYGFYSNMNTGTNTGYGGYFEHTTSSGSSYGIRAEANFTGTGNPSYNYAGYFQSNSTTRDARGLYVDANMTDATATASNYGAYIDVDQAGTGTTEGIYADAYVSHTTGSGTVYGGYIRGRKTSSNASGTVYGIRAESDEGSTGYGVYGRATDAVTNYGIYGTASGGTTNYAGYFSGAFKIVGDFSNQNVAFSGATSIYGSISWVLITSVTLTSSGATGSNSYSAILVDAFYSRDLPSGYIGRWLKITKQVNSGAETDLCGTNTTGYDEGFYTSTSINWLDQTGINPGDNVTYRLYVQSPTGSGTYTNYGLRAVEVKR